MKKFGIFLAGFIVITTGCTSNLSGGLTNTPTLTSTIDTVATIAAEETKFALETKEVEAQHLTETAKALGVTETIVAQATGTKSAANTAIADFLASGAPTATTSGGGSFRYTDCQDATGGRTQVKFENYTKDTAYITLVGPETRYCAVPPGNGLIFIKAGFYLVTSNVCGGDVYVFSLVLNSSVRGLILRC